MIIPASVLYKKRNLIQYHSVHEAVATDIILFSKDDGETNLEDLLTEVMNGQKRWDLCNYIFC